MRYFILIFSLIIMSGNLIGQTLEESNEIRKKSFTPERLKELQKVKEHYEQFKELKKLHNWPEIKIEKGDTLVLSDFEGDKPIYQRTPKPLTGYTVNITKANSVHSGGSLGYNVEGSGFLLSVMDLDLANRYHQDFVNPNNISESKIAFGNQFGIYTNYVKCDSFRSHSTIVAGSAIASGDYYANPSNRSIGIAPKASVLSMKWTGWYLDYINYLSDSTNIFSLVSNHSYDNDLPYTTCGESYYDKLMNLFPYHLVVFGNPNADWDYYGYYSIYTKNSISVGECNQGYVALQKSIPLAFEKYRFNPILTGRNLGSVTTSLSPTSYTWTGNSSGTSFVAPQVSAASLLFQELYKNYFGDFLKASTVKALLVHSARDFGDPGPDFERGYGMINVAEGAEIIRNKSISSDIVEFTLTNSNNVYNYTFTSNYEGDPIKATLCWADPLGFKNNRYVIGTNDYDMLVNDLDIKVIDPSGTVTYPWRIDYSNPSNVVVNRGDNTKDNLEMVVIDSVMAGGTYTIQISAKGNLQKWNNSVKVPADQDFSLIISGKSPCDTLTLSNNLIISQTASLPGIYFANAKKLTLRNELLGNNTKAKYVALNDIICEDGFFAHNAESLLKIEQCGYMDNEYNPINRDILYFPDPCAVNPIVQNRTFIQEEILSKDIEVYPNPNNGVANIRLPYDTNGNITLYDATGNLVHQQDFKNNKDIKLDLVSMNLKKGIYVVIVRTDSNTYSKKIIYN